MAWGANARVTPLRTVFHSQSSGSLFALTKSGIPVGLMSCSTHEVAINNDDIAPAVFTLTAGDKSESCKLASTDLTDVYVVRSSWLV